MFTHDIYHNIRTRVIVLHGGKMLLHAPGEGQTRAGIDTFRVLPGGGLEPDETLYEAGEREVFEETGLRVSVTSVAFLREWVVPKYVSVQEMKAEAEASGFEFDPSEFPDHGYGLEVYLWAALLEAGPSDPKPHPDDITGRVAEWIPLEQVEREPLFPTELKALARDLAEGGPPVRVPSFATGFGTPWDEPDYGAFRKAKPPHI
jgi:8-oxo-dGTP pyrophosphatase MutT (NUDIX family)